MALRALVIEDSPEVRKLAGIVLKREGFEVEEASGGGEGLRKMNEKSFDLLVLDLMMAPPNGFDILEVVKSKNPELLKHTLVVTAQRHPQLPAEVCQCLEKPFDLDTLKQFIHACAEDHAGA